LKATGRTAARALTVLKGASNLLNAEIKHLDLTTSDTPNQTATVTYLSGIAQGDTNLTRDGNSVKLKGGLIKTVYVIHASATASRIRHIIFVDLRNRSAAPTASDVFDTAASGNGLLNLDSAPNRFVVLHDEYVRLDTASNRVFAAEVPIPALDNVHLNYVGTGATAASAEGPSVWSILQSTESTNTPSVVMHSRLFFVDN